MKTPYTRYPSLLHLLPILFVLLIGRPVHAGRLITPTSALSRFLVDVTIPALILTQMLSTINSASLHTE